MAYDREAYRAMRNDPEKWEARKRQTRDATRRRTAEKGQGVSNRQYADDGGRHAFHTVPAKPKKPFEPPPMAPGITLAMLMARR
jgi:hypothetical protein